MTREQLQRLVDGALCVIDKCDEDGGPRFATWQAWDFGNVAGGQPWCDRHCPPCTEQRDGCCKEAADGHLLAIELNALLEQATEPNSDDSREQEKKT